MRNNELVHGSLRLDRFALFLRSEAKDPRSAHDNALYPCQRADGAPVRGLDELQALTC